MFVFKYETRWKYNVQEIICTRCWRMLKETEQNECDGPQLMEFLIHHFNGKLLQQILSRTRNTEMLLPPFARIRRVTDLIVTVPLSDMTLSSKHGFKRWGTIQLRIMKYEHLIWNESTTRGTQHPRINFERNEMNHKLEIAQVVTSGQ